MSERLTDDDVARILRVLPEIEKDGEASYGVVLGRLGDGPDTLDTWDVHKLVAEVQRLRADEWLRTAAGEIYDRSERLSRTIDHEAERSIVEILKRHRDGGA